MSYICTRDIDIICLQSCIKNVLLHKLEYAIISVYLNIIYIKYAFVYAFTPKKLVRNTSFFYNL